MLTYAEFKLCKPFEFEMSGFVPDALGFCGSVEYNAKKFINEYFNYVTKLIIRLTKFGSIGNNLRKKMRYNGTWFRQR